ncbi:hypothetical protein L3X38_013720 [Prunus dulcis]|uniref:Uncharacterized protein n=1 Tax=Prunus dulcis TaxID=3755 RepID=A0AAD4WLR9_PRUDU|nr:hypothetical protein L3X38_013720 [Prunus dulcis]
MLHCPGQSKNDATWLYFLITFEYFKGTAERLYSLNIFQRTRSLHSQRTELSLPVTASSSGIQTHSFSPLVVKIKRESAEGCVKDFVFGSKRQPEREIEKLALNSAKEYH